MHYTRGEITPQAHVDIPKGLCEEEFGRSGFFGRYAHLYRSSPPVSWTRIEGPLKPRAFDLNQSPNKLAQDYFFDRVVYLYNEDVSIQFSCLEKPMDYYFRNADGDEIFFVHTGCGRLSCDFGNLYYKKGDYLVVPKGTVYTLEPKESTKFLIVESKGQVKLPDKGMLGQHALFDPCMIKVPDLQDKFFEPRKSDKDEFRLAIKRNNQLTNVYYPHSPLNTVGWKGTLSVWQINVADIRPVSSDRYHLPPSAHTTFLSSNFVVCSFLPRPLENSDSGALKVPFYHMNIDYDEVLFYHSGDFFSRDGVGSGMMTLHPQGIHHGPQKEAVERSKSLQRTNEVAVMIDTRNSLKVSKHIDYSENKNYWKSWRS